MLEVHSLKIFRESYKSMKIKKIYRAIGGSQ